MSVPEDKIPFGPYCFDKNGICPFWSIRNDLPHRRNGYCAFLKRGDWEYPNSWDSLLWDRVKGCGIKTECQTGEQPV